jgi:hypothetical protein
MEMQKFHPIDTTILGLNRIFHSIGEDSFYTSSPNILAQDHIISRGLRYFLIGTTISVNLDINTVILLDAYYFEDKLKLLVQDMISGRKYALTDCPDCRDKFCSWVLIDTEYLLKKVKGGKHATK